jgi:glucose-6-phosphate isomerase
MANVYVNVTWLKQLNMKSKGKCLCKCYMTETVQYEIKRKCLCKYVTWLKQLNMKSKGKCLCECYMTETVQY